MSETRSRKPSWTQREKTDAVAPIFPFDSHVARLVTMPLKFNDIWRFKPSQTANSE